MSKRAVFCFFWTIGTTLGWSVPANAALTSEALARRAVTGNPSESAAAIAQLRSMGPEGLDLLLQVYGDQIARRSIEALGQRAADPEWRQLTATLDAVSQQRDSYASRLYWYTDIEQAKTVARATGKPILSLRLLGNLNEEFSCANSRFFRSTLYANSAVSQFLRENFILHWKSVRPAPRVTIDFGDGRKLERTVTGNSIHYVLDSDGRPIDAIPGLYGPAAFLKVLTQALGAFRSIAPAGAGREAGLRAYHQSAKDAAAAEFKADIRRSGAGLKPESNAGENLAGLGFPDAVRAAPLAVSKSVVEIKTVKSISETGKPQAPTTPDGDLAEWEKIAALHTADATLDASSIALISSQYTSIDAHDARMLRTLKNLEHYIAVDSVRNEYLLHARLHEWFLGGALGQDIEALNEKVYTFLFLTPGSDPWLGLVSPDAYTGLVDDGITGGPKTRE